MFFLCFRVVFNDFCCQQLYSFILTILCCLFRQVFCCRIWRQKARFCPVWFLQKSLVWMPSLKKDLFGLKTTFVAENCGKLARLSSRSVVVSHVFLFYVHPYQMGWNHQLVQLFMQNCRYSETFSGSRSFFWHAKVTKNVVRNIWRNEDILILGSRDCKTPTTTNSLMGVPWYSYDLYNLGPTLFVSIPMCSTQNIPISQRTSGTKTCICFVGSHTTKKRNTFLM